MADQLAARFATRRGAEHGFTLIELLVAIVLLSGALLGTAALTGGVILGNANGRNQTTASAIAQSCFQENRRVGYTDAGTSSSSNGCPAGTATVSLGSVTFTRVLDAVDVSVTNVKTLTVTVSWTEGRVGTKSVKLKTSIAS